MGNKESKKNSDTITPENDNRTSSKETKSKRSKSKKEKKSIEQKTPKTPRKEQQVMMPVDPNAVFANKEFLNDLSVFIVKAYDTKFDGTFNEYLVSHLAEDCIRELDSKYNGQASRDLHQINPYRNM